MAIKTTLCLPLNTMNSHVKYYANEYCLYINKRFPKCNSLRALSQARFIFTHSHLIPVCEHMCLLGVLNVVNQFYINIFCVYLHH